MVTGIIIALWISAYPAYLGLSFNTDKQQALTTSLSENTKLKANMAKKELEAVNKRLLAIGEAGQTHNKALLSTVSELEAKKLELEARIESYISEEATKEAQKTSKENSSVFSAVMSKILPE